MAFFYLRDALALDCEAEALCEADIAREGAVRQPLGARLSDERVVCLAQQVFEIGQMLQISQGVLSSFANWDS